MPFTNTVKEHLNRYQGGNDHGRMYRERGHSDGVGALGVDFGQGFAIGLPRPVEEVLQDLLRGSAGVVRSSPNRPVS